MARHGYFGHASADGGVFWRRIERYYAAEGTASWAVGETLLWSIHRVAPAVMVRRWLRSATHRTVVLGPRYRELGPSVLIAAGAPGFFGGRNVLLVTVDFGVRRD